jgi:hypothetical protein
MGAFGFDIFDNDTALDTLGEFVEDYLYQFHKSAIKSYDIDEMLAKLDLLFQFCSVIDNISDQEDLRKKIVELKDKIQKEIHKQEYYEMWEQPAKKKKLVDTLFSAIDEYMDSFNE